jgi:hypothetical protein
LREVPSRSHRWSLVQFGAVQVLGVGRPVTTTAWSGLIWSLVAVVFSVMTLESTR